MKLTEDNVRKIALEIILDLEPFACRDDREVSDLAMYTAGVAQMAQALIEALQEVRNV